MNLMGADLLNSEIIPEIVLLITTVAGSALTVVARVQRKLKDNTVQFIGRAEEKFADQENAGGAKHDYVVNKLYSQVPAVFRPFVSKERLSGLVNGTFESVNRFSELRSSNFPGADETDGSQTTNMAESPPATPDSPVYAINHTIPAEGGGAKINATKVDSSHKQMPCNRVLQNNSLQGTVRVFTLRGGHGFLFRAEYRVCKRHGYRNRGRC